MDYFLEEIKNMLNLGVELNIFCKTNSNANLRAVACKSSKYFLFLVSVIKTAVLYV